MMLINSQVINSMLLSLTKSYRPADPASHAGNKITQRNQLMFMSLKTIYVYLIYGMHYCLNFVCEEDEFPSAVLVGAVQVIEPKLLDLERLGKCLGKCLGKGVGKGVGKFKKFKN